MEADILKYLKVKPTLDEIYGKIPNEDLIAKKIEVSMEEDK